MQARSIEREELYMKITPIFLAVLLALTAFEWKVAEGGSVKEEPRAADPGATKPPLAHVRSLVFAILANERRHSEIIRQALASPDTVLRRDGRVIAAWREVARNENKEGGARKQKAVFADRSTQTVQREVDRNGQKVRELLVVYGTPEHRVTEKYLSEVYRSIGPGGRPVVGFSFNERGATLFGRLTREHAPQPDGFHSRLAILLDDQIYAAPQVNEPIEGGSGIIDSGLTSREVDELVKSLSHLVPKNKGEGGKETPEVKAPPKQ